MRNMHGRLLEYLKRCQNMDAYPSHAEIAATLDIHPQTVANQIGNLRRAGLIDWPVPEKKQSKPGANLDAKLKLISKPDNLCTFRGCNAKRAYKSHWCEAHREEFKSRYQRTQIS